MNLREHAEWVAGVSYTDQERELMLDGINELVDSFARLREVDLDNSEPPALIYQPAALEETPPAESPGRVRPSAAAGERPVTVAGSLYTITNDPRTNHQVALTHGVLESECATILQQFFARQRTLGKK